MSLNVLLKCDNMYHRITPVEISHGRFLFIGQKGKEMDTIETIKEWNECRLPTDLFLETLKRLDMNEYSDIFLTGSSAEKHEFLNENPEVLECAEMLLEMMRREACL